MKKIKNFNLTKKLSALILAVALVASTAIALGFGFKSVSASAATANVERSGLGLSVDAVKTDYLDLTELKDGSPIFDTAWLTSQVNNANYISVGATKTKSYTGSKFETVSKDFATDLNFNSRTSLDMDLFLVALSKVFKVNAELKINEYASQYYYLFQNRIDRYTLSLPNYSSNLSEYSSNLNSTYLAALQKVFNGQMTYENLFNTYGTHVILKGIYGGMVNMSYHFLSNKCDVGGSGAAKIAAGISAGINNVINLNSGASFDINATMQCVSGDIAEDFNLVARGGGAFTGISMTDFSNSFKTWANSVVNSPVLVAPSSDGLVPLWELLPSQYSNRKEEFKDAFIKYSESYNNKIYEQNRTFDLSICDALTFSILRETEYTITDDGIMDQYFDVFNLGKYKEIYGYDVLSAYRFNNVTVSLRLEMREINRGYQHFYLYLDIDKSAQAVDEIKYEYGGNSLKKDYTYVTHTFKLMNLIDITNSGANYYSYKPIVIRYGATGSGDDDWCNRNCTISVTFTK